MLCSITSPTSPTLARIWHRSRPCDSDVDESTVEFEDDEEGEHVRAGLAAAAQGGKGGDS